MNLKKFPFDFHVLSIIICSGFSIEKLIFKESTERKNIMGNDHRLGTK